MEGTYGTHGFYLYIYTLYRLWQVWATRASSLILHPYFLYRLSSLYAKEKKAVKYIETLAPNMVSHAIEMRKTELSNGMATDRGEIKPMIAIDKLLDLEERGLMDRQRVLDQTNTLAVGVSESYTKKSNKSLISRLYRAPTILRLQF